MAHPPGRLSRRHLLAAGLMAPLSQVPAQAQAPVLNPRVLQFPRDRGSHPDFSIEWWYVTGRLVSGVDAEPGASAVPTTGTASGSGSGRREFGFQLTFFRSRVAATQTMRSRFAAKQLIFAHAAVTDVAGKRLMHDQRIAREGFGVAQASEHDTAVTLRDWSLTREATQYRAMAAGDGFRFDLSLQETQPLLLQGDRGLSRKGPDATQASYYYSLPQLQVAGSLVLASHPMPVQGTAWLDHEWSQAMLHPQAVGWDWIGMNLRDGSALTAFRLRDGSGNSLWTGGSYRHPSMGAAPHVFSHGDLQFQAIRSWTSPLTQARYPVEWTVRIKPTGTDSPPSEFYTIKAVIDNQELDSRASTGAVYWEGLSALFDSSGDLVGHGYLEMTGYAGALRL